MKSIWNDNIKKHKFNKLESDVKTDVLIIGGGMCGILCAYMLKNAGVDYVLVEADEICGGVTNSTTAKLTFQHGLLYDKIIRKYGVEKAQMYYQSQKEALDKLKVLCLENDADLEMCNAVVYSLDNREKIENELKAYEKVGCDAKFYEKTELPFSVAAAVGIKEQARFHPLKLAYKISKDLNIYEKTKVIALKGNTAITDTCKITADKIIVATHFPFLNKHGGYFLKMYQHRSYVLALKGAPEIQNMYIDESGTGLSFRSYKDLLLLGGGGHRTGKQGGNWKELTSVAQTYYPNASEAVRWATQDCMTLDSIPYIGRYSNSTTGLYVATGFNKWGMTSSYVSAMILTDMVCKRRNEYEELYSPSRTMLHSQLGVNMLESTLGLITPTKPRCPHLGCALKYNKHEHSWDCTCHGSRFGQDGKLLNNPATDDIFIKK